MKQTLDQRGKIERAREKIGNVRYVVGEPKAGGDANTYLLFAVLEALDVLLSLHEEE